MRGDNETKKRKAAKWYAIEKFTTAENQGSIMLKSSRILFKMPHREWENQSMNLPTPVSHGFKAAQRLFLGTLLNKLPCLPQIGKLRFTVSEVESF